MSGSEAKFDHVALTGEERLAISAVVHQHYYMPDVFSAVAQIVSARLTTARSNIRAREVDLRGLVARSPAGAERDLTTAYADGLAEALHLVTPPGATS